MLGLRGDHLYTVGDDRYFYRFVNVNFFGI
jgi:hypothetical protein